MSSDREKRKHPRIPREEILSIKLIAPPTEFAYQGEPLYCSTEDVSAEGMRIHVNHELEPDQAVDIWIVLLDQRGTFHLTGEVSWIQPASELEESAGQWVAGVALLDESEHLREWRELFLED
jgi:Tfp pilus assembly protein PilZ